MNRTKVLIAGVALLFLGVGALGCPICLGIGPMERTLADEMMAANDVVVAQFDGTSDSGLVGRVMKGDSALRNVRVRVEGFRGAGGRVLARGTGLENWVDHGQADGGIIQFLEGMKRMRVGMPGGDSEWDDRLAAFRPYLGHRDPRLARSAWSEWAKAPYSAIRRQRVEPALVRAWQLDPGQAYARSLWWIVLGIAGDAEDVRNLNEQLGVAWASNDAFSAAALLTARIEREGRAGVTWLDEHYLRDRDRTLDEVKAAVAALGVHGDASPILRPCVLNSCRLMMAERRPLSGLVARILLTLGDWGGARHFEGLLASGEPVLPETRPAIQAYLAACRQNSAAASEDSH